MQNWVFNNFSGGRLTRALIAKITHFTLHDRIGNPKRNEYLNIEKMKLIIRRNASIFFKLIASKFDFLRSLSIFRYTRVLKRIAIDFHLDLEDCMYRVLFSPFQSPFWTASISNIGAVLEARYVLLSHAWQVPNRPTCELVVDSGGFTVPHQRPVELGRWRRPWWTWISS